MIAIVLAAGRGTRLGELGEDLPKCLLPIGGRPSLGWYAHAFERAAVVDEVIVVGGHRIDEVRRQLPAGFRLIENERYDRTNSLTSLWLALETIEDRDIAVVNADVVYHPDLLTRFLRSPRRTAVLVDELRPFDEREFHVRVADGLVRELSRSVSAADSFGEDAQIFKVAREHLPLVRAWTRQQLEGGDNRSYAGGVLAGLIDQGLLHPIYTNEEPWSEFDTIEDYRRCVELVEGLDGWMPRAETYGLGDEATQSPSAGAPADRDHDDPQPAAGAATRAWHVIAHRRLPWRLRWIPVLPVALRLEPRRALRWLWPLITSSLPLESFRLLVYGPTMLAAIMSEAVEIGIRPFLMWGTLLACVREGAFIRHDHDVDLALSTTDFLRVPELKRRMLARGYRIRHESANKVSFLHPTRPCFVDIDRVIEVRDHLWIAEPPGDAPSALAYWFPRASMAELTPRTFEGVEVFVPRGAEEILTAIYGTWRIPQQKRSFARGPLNLMLWRQAVAGEVSQS